MNRGAENMGKWKQETHINKTQKIMFFNIQITSAFPLNRAYDAKMSQKSFQNCKNRYKSLVNAKY